MSGVLPHGRGCGELDPGDLLGLPLALEAGHHLLGALEHRLGGLCLGRLRPHPVGLVGERLRLVLGVHPLALAPLLVGLALLEVGPPAHVVDVDLGAVGVQVEHPVDAALQQGGVVADDHQPALVGDQEVAQPDDRVGVEVVGGLVEQQRLRAREQDPRQLDPAPLATGQRVQRLGEHPVLDAEAVRDLRGLRLGGVPTAGVEVVVGPRVATHRAVAHVRVVAAHLGLGLAQPAYGVVEAARGQDAFAGEHVGAAGAGILRQVADLTGRLDRPGGGQAFPGEDLGERGLAGPVATDETDLVPRGYAERHVFHQQASPGPDLELVGGDHDWP